MIPYCHSAGFSRMTGILQLRRALRLKQKHQITSENEVLIPININKDGNSLNRDYGQKVCDELDTDFPAEQIRKIEEIINEDKEVEQESKSKTQTKRKPHVIHNSGNDEWYTPAEYTEAAMKVMGSIDLAPASCKTANQIVKKANYYTAKTDVLQNEWYGNIFLNPPYASKLVEKFIDKLVNKHDNYQQAIVLINNATETKWFYKLIRIASAVVFPKGRIKFYTPSGKTGSPLQGQAIVYIGNKSEIFVEKFKIFGWCAIL